MIQANARSTTSPAQTAALERRIAADLRWRPGDAEPTSRELARPDPPVGAKSTSILWSTVIRNRCNTAASITVGPADLAPGAVTVDATLAAGEAINVGLTSEDWVHLQAADGTYHHRAQAAVGFLIITGGSECHEIVGLAR